MLSILIALVISNFQSTEIRAIISAISLSHQQQMLTERMGLLAHKRLLTYQLGEDPRAVEGALQQAIASYEVLLNTNNEYLSLTRMFNKSQPFNNAQLEIMLKQREAWAAYHFTLRHFINDKNLFIKQLHAIEQSEQQQYELTTRLIQSIQAQSEARLTNLTLLRFLILLTTLLSLFWLVFTNTTQCRALRKTSAQHAARVHLLDVCLKHANDMIIIAEAGAIDEPLGPRIVYVNEAFTRLTGYSAEDALGKTPRILQGPLSQREELAKIRHALKHWQSVRVEVLNYTKTGELFWVEMDISPIADENGWFTHWISIQRDITERKAQQARFDELALRYQTILNEMPALIAYWDKDQRNVFSNHV
ncbi:MAG: PAS domain S-box protein, partial [Methylovulum sp.]|nr:PAS domain S-box protein [Methylovulum sp.]